MTSPPTEALGSGVARLLVEGVVIVVSILLAFAIDAWWGELQEQRVLDDQRSALQAQVESNLDQLVSDSARVARGWAAERELIHLISPSPRSIPVDSLRQLFGLSFQGDVGPLEVSALEAMLSTGRLATDDPALQRLLIRFRSAQAQAEESQVLRLGHREDLISYLSGIAPTGFISASTGAHEDTDFDVPVRDILSDRKLESLVGNIAVRSIVMTYTIVGLRETADSILIQLAR